MKTYLAIASFCNAELLCIGLERAVQTRGLNSEIWVYEDFWPLHRECNQRILQACQKRHGFKLIQSDRNRGLHHGLNYLTSQMPLEEDDILITIAPDSYMVKDSWDWAMQDVLLHDPEIAYVGLTSFVTGRTPNVEWDKRETEGGVKYEIPSIAVQSHATAWKWSFLKQVGGFDEPTNYYGHLEGVMHRKAQLIGMKQAYLPDFQEDFPEGVSRLYSYEPEIYKEWKFEHAQTFSFPGNFEEYLKRHGQL